MRLAQILLIATLVAGCGREPAPREPGAPRPESPAQPKVNLANPASTHCVELGGRLSIEKGPTGGEFGVCLFEDNRQCEEWALLRGECPVGGRRITGYATEAGRYCAITGGQYTVTSGNDSSDEKGTCTLAGGKVCDAEAYRQGSCGT